MEIFRGMRERVRRSERIMDKPEVTLAGWIGWWLSPGQVGRIWKPFDSRPGRPLRGGWFDGLVSGDSPLRRTWIIDRGRFRVGAWIVDCGRFWVGATLPGRTGCWMDLGGPRNFGKRSVPARGDPIG